MNVAELLVRCLENEGVKHVFGIPGEETLALNAALAESDKISFILTRHEQGAAFMADVYGRLSSYPGVCLATLGPGATNLLTGVADAQLGRAPPGRWASHGRGPAAVRASKRRLRDAHVHGQGRARPLRIQLTPARGVTTTGRGALERPAARVRRPRDRGRL